MKTVVEIQRYFCVISFACVDALLKRNENRFSLTQHCCVKNRRRVTWRAGRFLTQHFVAATCCSNLKSIQIAATFLPERCHRLLTQHCTGMHHAKADNRAISQRQHVALKIVPCNMLLPQHCCVKSCRV